MSLLDPPDDQAIWAHPGFAIDVGAGTPLVVRCHTPQRWQALEAGLQPFILSFATIYDAGRLPDAETAYLSMCDHIMILLPAIFESTGLDAYTFGALPHECSELVLRAWWAVNGAYQVSHIFGRLAETRVALRFVARR